MKCEGKTNRTGLYILIFIILLKCCDSNARIKNIEDHFNINKKTFVQENLSKGDSSNWLDYLDSFFISDSSEISNAD